ncbi:MAG: hypothetical protein QOH03_2519 [Kribbellaceae bacterium]|nr:hypothetical protein [Kribbellaceae bacterium]
MLAACGSEPSPGGGSLDGRSFLSVSVNEDGKPKELAPNTRIGLRFEGGDVHAETGCNQLGGKVSTDGGKLTVDQLGGTDMGCDPARHAQEDWVGQLLRDKPAWKLDADKLTLTRGTTTLVLQDRETAQPDKALDGTRWMLESVVSGQTASHLAGSEKAYLTVNGERVTGSTGCNDFQGVVARTAGKLTFGELSITTAGCSGDVGKLEQSVRAALSGELTYTIEADRLQLRAANGNGLDLVAG